MDNTSNHGTATPARPGPTSTSTTTTTPFSNESPLRFRASDSSKYRLGGTNAKRDVVMSELNRQVPEVPLDWYFEHLLPPLPDGVDTERILSSLKQSQVIEDNKWSFIPQHPCQDKRHEDLVYAGLEMIFAEIITAAKAQNHDLVQEFALKLTPRARVVSERNSTTKPDGHFMSLEDAARLDREGEKPSVYEVWDSHEFKKENESVRHVMDECVGQLVYDMQQIMALDPCRRFAFGTSIMNRSFRLWFCSRGTFLTATPFDFISDPEKLIRVFVSFAFASRPDAGWDTSMACIPPASPTEKRRYKIQVGSKTYVTIKMLSDYAADSPIGRATRVWLVVDEVGPSDRYYVLKDVWVDAERDTEDEIRSNLLKDVEEKCGSKARDKVERHLLTPVAFEKLRIGASADDTTQLIMRGGSLPQNLDHLKLTVFQQSESSTRSQVSPSDNAIDSVFSGTRARYLQQGDTGRKTPQVTSRFHYRIVFSERATTLYDEKNLGNVLGALADVTEALQWIHKSNWVHRDISCGNVYWYGCKSAGIEDRSRGLLGDLEFAKARIPGFPHEIRTGTFNFMASEVIAGNYLFLPRTGFSMFSGFNLRQDPARLLAIDSLTPISSITPLPFNFNPLHDMESIWWILVYILYFNDDGENGADAELANKRAAKAQLLFAQDGLIYQERQLFLEASLHLTVQQSCLSLSFGPIFALARAMGTILYAAYCDSEAKSPVIDEEAFGVHEALHQVLHVASNNPQINTVQLVGTTRPQKRKIEDAEHSRGNGSSRSKRARNDTHNS
ncbi:hypothetical protein F5050DRAFT_1830616 [Lentinula boryana]|uniref:Fungal-type protein kinase domain-containing protein n=1 Tax=Lentinula boryana TaxID=40481 RepID=A0ABQ8Q9F1_9AGAR|nr:hypothetical protein F5050DRAFT_1830616 [Lentinula boryana]